MKMKKIYLFGLAAAALFAGCSSHDIVDENYDAMNEGRQIPIEFSVQKQNITRATNLERVKHYNFGVWAWKVQGKNGLADQEVMNHYLVGWSNGTDKGYDNSQATTWANVPGSTIDHTSPWFYEKLGTDEYTYDGAAGFYKATDLDYMSANRNQYLRYWDLAYAKTNFYCYAPYNKDVTFTKGTTESTMSFGATEIRDGYDEPLNSAYNAYSRTLGEYMYAGVQATNASLSDVTVPFKHMGAQLFIRFYEDIPGYKVEIIDLAADKATAPTEDKMKGIQATPAVKTAGTPATYSNGLYWTTQGATVTFDEDDAEPHYSANWTGATTATNTSPLMFKIPEAGLTTAGDAPANLTDYAGLAGTTHKIIREAVATGSDQEYSYSPTIYYPVAQPTKNPTTGNDNLSGLTFHISYRVIAEDNKEVLTVHNATVFVPAIGNVKEGPNDNELSDAQNYITVWRPNVKYTYTFKFTRGTTGTTNPDTPIDPTDPNVSETKSLYPIVFDYATIDDYTLNYSEYEVSEGTEYNQTNP